MSMDASYIKFVVGSRQLFSVQRSLITISYSLENLIDQKVMAVSDDTQGSHGFRILSAPRSKFDEIIGNYASCVVGGFQSYRRYYIDMSGSYDDYLAQFSSKTRSTFNRKRRKLAEHSGGTLDIREYRTSEELIQFLDHALPLSALTYQARLLDAGLPESTTARSEMLALAEKDSLRAYILFVNGEAASYLYLPIKNGIITYAFLGYDPEIANLSPGTVLQLEALERLYTEKKYRFFDFTEGEGAHKQMFATGSVEACSFFLLKNSLSNRLLLSSLDVFDRTIATLKRLAERSKINSYIRRRLRGQ